MKNKVNKQYLIREEKNMIKITANRTDNDNNHHETQIETYLSGSMQDGSETAVLKSINGDCKLVYDYSITGSSMTWLHSVTYSEQPEALRDLLSEKKKVNLTSPNITSVFKRTPK